MSTFSISKQQTNILKGVGILLIVLHNYFHWVSPLTGENEFVFDVQHTLNMFGSLKNSIAEIPNTLFTFFGHYGVQLFIFISGYGLAKSYQKKQQTYVKFIKKRIAKIYPAFLIAIVLLILYNFIVKSYTPTLSWLAKICLKIAMLHTLVPRQALSINGPWWFYGLIFQLYILFIPLFYCIKRWRWYGFMLITIISYIGIFILYQPLLNIDIYIMANALGHVPEFILGIALALLPKFERKWYWFLLSIVIFSFGNVTFYVFPFSFLAITYVLITSLSTNFKKQAWLVKIIIFYGELSMFLFAVHAFFRNPFFVNTANNSSSALEKVAIGFLYLLVVTLVAVGCKKLYHTAITYRISKDMETNNKE